jgi:hypothetical protein
MSEVLFIFLVLVTILVFIYFVYLAASSPDKGILLDLISGISVVKASQTQ